MVGMSWWFEYWAGVVDNCLAHLVTWSPPSPGEAPGKQ